MNKKNKGFTLIELMIVIAIIGILGAVGYPAYTSMVKKSNRADGVDSLLSLAARMEEHYNVNDTYVGATVANATSSDDYYTLAIDTATLYEYTLSATPAGWTDDECNVLTYDSLGKKGSSVNGATDCW